MNASPCEMFGRIHSSDNCIRFGSPLLEIDSTLLMEQNLRTLVLVFVDWTRYSANNTTTTGPGRIRVEGTRGEGNLSLTEGFHYPHNLAKKLGNGLQVTTLRKIS
jgi:hypothetical protein